MRASIVVCKGAPHETEITRLMQQHFPAMTVSWGAFYRKLPNLLFDLVYICNRAICLDNYRDDRVITLDITAGAVSIVEIVFEFDDRETADRYGKLILKTVSQPSKWYRDRIQFVTLRMNTNHGVFLYSIRSGDETDLVSISVMGVSTKLKDHIKTMLGRIFRVPIIRNYNTLGYTVLKHKRKGD